MDPNRPNPSIDVKFRVFTSFISHIPHMMTSPTNQPPSRRRHFLWGGNESCSLTIKVLRCPVILGTVISIPHARAVHSVTSGD